MSAAEVIEQLESEGVGLALAPSGGLDVSGDEEAVKKVLPLLRQHKAEIVGILSLAKDTITLPTEDFCSKKSESHGEGAISNRAPSCWNCGHYDGGGSSFPGVCRYFETIGQEAKEIDPAKVSPDEGCGRFWVDGRKDALVGVGESKCGLTPISPKLDRLESQTVQSCTVIGQSPPVGLGESKCGLTPTNPTLDRLGSSTAQNCAQSFGVFPHMGEKGKEGGPGLNWCRDHLVDLLSGGWTEVELFKESWPLGLAHLLLWDRAGVGVSLGGDGRVVFTIPRPDGSTVTQTARPDRR